MTRGVSTVLASMLAAGLGATTIKGIMDDLISETLASRGVHTWADLKEDDAGSAVPPEQRYKLVVIVSDVSRGLMLRLPWDYPTLLGLDPDTQPVDDAVRGSASIPFFFETFRMKADPATTGTRRSCVPMAGCFPTTGLSAEDKTKLFTNGHSSGQMFLASWDWEKWDKGEYAELLAAKAAHP